MKVLSFLGYLLRSMGLIGWCIGVTILGFFFIVITPQGLELLISLNESNSFLFTIGTMLWGLSVWYSARLIFSKKFPTIDDEFYKNAKGIHIELPRILGFLCVCTPALGFFRIENLYPTLKQNMSLPIMIFFSLAIFLCLFMRYRRSISLLNLPKTHNQLETMDPLSLKIIIASFALSLALIVLFIISPLSSTRFFGSPAILMFSLASWTLFGSMILTYLPMANGWIKMTMVFFGVAVLFSFLNNNHAVRVIRGNSVPVERKEPDSHFQNWFKSLQKSDGRKPCPVFIVAAAGGGIRATYWTAAVLGRLADTCGAEWPKHVYAMSGISGGSIGIAAHCVQIAEAFSSKNANDWSSPHFFDNATSAFKRDLLSPILGYLLFPDMLQRFLPFPISYFDRARAFELAMEDCVRQTDGIGSKRFEEHFMKLWSDPTIPVPALLLNTTIVETGQRGILSNLKLDPNVFRDSLDLIEQTKEAQMMSLSTAAHLGARFTYVSPAGRMRLKNSKSFFQVVDGGYFENSGTETARDLIRALRLNKDDIEVHLILITNDSNENSICENPKVPSIEPMRFMTEIRSPIECFLNTREARGALSMQRTLDNDRPDSPSVNQEQIDKTLPQSMCDKAFVHEFRLNMKKQPVPLGWTLARETTKAIDEHLKSIENQFEQIYNIIRSR